MLLLVPATRGLFSLLINEATHKPRIDFPLREHIIYLEVNYVAYTMTDGCLALLLALCFFMAHSAVQVLLQYIQRRRAGRPGRHTP